MNINDIKVRFNILWKSIEERKTIDNLNGTIITENEE